MTLEEFKASRSWKLNRFILFFLFIYTAFYTLINRDPALNVLYFYRQGSDKHLEDEANKDL